MADFDEANGSPQSQFTRRSLLLGGAQAAGLGLVVWRLFDLQVAGASRYAPMAEDNRISLQPIAPKRGRILDAFGRVLADNEEMFGVTITPALARNVIGVLQRVRPIVPLSDEDIDRLAVRARKRGRNVPTTIATDVSFEQVAQLNLYAPSLPGIKTDFAWRRRYRDGAALSHVVGFTGSVERFGIEDDAVARLPEMRIGKIGAELAFDADLRGTGGTQKSEVDARGRIVRNLETVEPVGGADISLTIDADLQRDVVSRLQIERRGSAVVIDIASGGVVVLASVPGFEPAKIAAGMSEADWTTLASSEDTPLLNRAVAGLYPPGSTFFVVTALAALQAGVTSLGEHVVCKGRFEYGGQIFPCSNPAGHGSVTIHDAIKLSCDVFFCEMASRLGIARIASAARAMGFGAASGIGLSEEKSGVVPDPDWKRGNLNSRWLGGETVLTGIGQGYMQATPLQLALMAARLASGRAVRPNLRRTDPANGDPAPAFEILPFDDAHLAPVRAAMIAAVNDASGTATSAKLGEGKPLVAGMTSGSEIGGHAPQDRAASIDRAKRSPALFIGYEPAEAPRYAVATVIEHGGDGEVAASVGRDVLNLVTGRDGRLGKSGTDDGTDGTRRSALVRDAG